MLEKPADVAPRLAAQLHNHPKAQGFRITRSEADTIVSALKRYNIVDHDNDDVVLYEDLSIDVARDLRHKLERDNDRNLWIVPVRRREPMPEKDCWWSDLGGIMALCGFAYTQPRRRRRD